MHVVYSFFSDLPTTTRMHIHLPGQHSHQECHQCIHAGVYKGQLLRYDGIRMLNCCVIVLKYKDFGVERMYNFCFISGCAARGDRHGHLKDSSEENSGRKVSQVLHVLKHLKHNGAFCAMIIQVFETREAIVQIPTSSISTHTLLCSYMHSHMIKTDTWSTFVERSAVRLTCT